MQDAIGGQRDVIVGIRPEQFEDAAVVDAGKATQGVSFEATVDVVEWLGNEQYAYVPYEEPEHLRAGLNELEKELDSERVRSQLVVALDPSSRINPQSKAKLWFDPRRMHVFDAASGENLTAKALVTLP